jgi:transposase InsO family protein
MLIFGERHLRIVLGEYVRHYNRHRPHRSLQQRPPDSASSLVDLPTPRFERRVTLSGLVIGYSQVA